MRFDKVKRAIFTDLKTSIEGNDGLSIFACERAKFEGWLKVELCNILSRHSDQITPEKSLVDVTFDDWLIELKTINTNYRYSNVVRKTKPITNNVEGVVKDIKKLRKRKYKNKAVLFVVFPVIHYHKDWQKHLSKISKPLSMIKHQEFNFKKNIPGVIYLGLV